MQFALPAAPAGQISAVNNFALLGVKVKVKSFSPFNTCVS